MINLASLNKQSLISLKKESISIWFDQSQVLFCLVYLINYLTKVRKHTIIKNLDCWMPELRFNTIPNIDRNCNR